MRHVILLALLFAPAVFLVRDLIPASPFGFDESDYMFAASLGARTNWLDTGTMPIINFVKTGLRRGGQPDQRLALSAMARATNDPILYRHWHGPLYYYALGMVANLGPAPAERTTRGLFLLIPAITAMVIYFGSLLIVDGLEGRIAAILAAAMFLWSPVTLETTELAPHLLFVLTYTAALLFLSRAVISGSRKAYYLSAMCTGLAFCTLEVAFVLIVSLAMVAWWRRRELHADWTLVRNSVLFFLGTVLVIWPFGLLELHFAKAYLVMTYLAVFRKGAWGNVTLGQTWASHLAISPVEWVLMGVALVLFVFSAGNRARRNSAAFLIFGALMVLATLRVYSFGAHYMTTFFAALQVFAAWTLASALGRTRAAVAYAVAAALGALLLWNSAHRLSIDRLWEDPRPAALLAALRTAGLDGKTVLAPQGDIPIFHYYFPRLRSEAYLGGVVPGGSGNRHFDAIIYPDYTLKLSRRSSE